MFLKFKLVYSFRRANMHSVVQSGSLCGHCHASDLGMHYVVSCSVGEGMGFTGETWKPEMTRRGGGRISLISQCPQRPGHTAGHTL